MLSSLRSWMTSCGLASLVTETAAFGRPFDLAMSMSFLGWSGSGESSELGMAM